MWLSWRALVWALRFYRDHFWLVFGLSVVPTVQRFIAVRWGDDLPGWVGVAGEVLTMAARVLLVWAIVRIAFAGPGRRAWPLISAGIDRHLRVFLAQWLVLGVAFVIFDVIPNAAIAMWAPDGQRELISSILVSAKNPTVIALTFLWMAGIAYTLMCAGRREDLRPVARVAARS